jgi:hypothetical protein
MTLRRCPQCDSTRAIAEECRDCGYSFQITQDRNLPGITGLFALWVAGVCAVVIMAGCCRCDILL